MIAEHVAGVYYSFGGTAAPSSTRTSRLPAVRAGAPESATAAYLTFVDLKGRTATFHHLESNVERLGRLA